MVSAFDLALYFIVLHFKLGWYFKEDRRGVATFTQGTKCKQSCPTEYDGILLERYLREWHQYLSRCHIDLLAEGEKWHAKQCTKKKKGILICISFKSN